MKNVSATDQGNVGREMKAARSDTARFRKKSSEDEAGLSPEGDIRVTILVTAPSFGSQRVF